MGTPAATDFLKDGRFRADINVDRKGTAVAVHKRSYTDKQGRKREVWRVRWLETDRSGERKYRSRQFAKKADADKFFRSKQANRDDERAWGKGSIVTLEQLWEEYKTVVGAGWQPSTMMGYNGVWKNYLEPALGDRMLIEFQDSAKPLQELMNHLRAAKSGFGVGAGAERKTVGLLGMMLREAVEWNIINGHRCTPRARQLQSQRRRREPTLISLPQIELMLHHIRSRPLPDDEQQYTAEQLNLRDAAMFSIMAYAGLRPAEVLGLRRRDFVVPHALSNGHLVVDKQGVDGVERPIKNHRSTRASERQVPATRTLARSIKEWLIASPPPPIATRSFHRRRADYGRSTTSESGRATCSATQHPPPVSPRNRFARTTSGTRGA